MKDKQEKLVTSKAVVDTGNTLRVTCAISSKFHEKLGVGFREIKRKCVGTARKGSSLVCLGVSNPIEVQFDGINVKYLLTPRVLEDLHADLNVSNLFLKNRTQRGKGRRSSNRDEHKPWFPRGRS